MNRILTRRTALGGVGGVLLLSACGGSGDEQEKELGISAIPDQDPELLNRLYPAVADRFSEATGLTVVYRKVTDYTAVVRAFEVGDIHLAWMGGLTGVQARDRVKGSQAIAQRDIDKAFRSVFIAGKKSGLKPFTSASGLNSLAGHTFTFGSETSTSGRLMPQHFMQEAGLEVKELKGKPGFSGSHDATIEAVASGSFQAGAANKQVWDAAVADGTVDAEDAVVLWETPGYADYHWLARPDLDKVYGEGTRDSVVDLLLGLDEKKPEDAKILDLFGASSFIRTENGAYDRIEEIARDLGLLT